VKKGTAALTDRRRTGTGSEKSVPRPATVPAGPRDFGDGPLVLEDFLALPAEDPENEALRLFPGRTVVKKLHRAAFLDVVAAENEGAAGVAWLSKAHGLMGCELQDRDSGPTITEDALTAARDRLRDALSAVGRAFTLIRRARRLVPRPFRKLRAIT
jgi:hypothetical protein